MTLILRNDISHHGGGFALLEGAALSGVTAIMIASKSTAGQFLGKDGKWGRQAFAFPVEEGEPGVLVLGPNIVDHVPTELLIELRSGEGRVLGEVFWTDVIPSRNPKSCKTAKNDVIGHRQHHVEHTSLDVSVAEQSVVRTLDEKLSLIKMAEEEALRPLIQVRPQEGLETAQAFDIEHTHGVSLRFPDFATRTTAPRRPLWLYLCILIVLQIPLAAPLYMPPYIVGQRSQSASDLHVRSLSQHASSTKYAFDRAPTQPFLQTERVMMPSPVPQSRQGASDEGPEPYSAPTPGEETDKTPTRSVEQIGENFPTSAELLVKKAIDIEMGFNGEISSRPRAILWYNEAARQGSVRAMIRLGTLYKSENDALACKYFKLAAKNGASVSVYLHWALWKNYECKL